MDATFSAGKHKGKWYSDIAHQDAAFCSWAKRQKNPPGYLKQFLEFLRTGKRGQRAINSFFSVTVCTDAPTANHVPSSGVADAASEHRAEAISQSSAKVGEQFQCTLAIELCSATAFSVGPNDENATLPHKIRDALAAHPQGQAASAASQWIFPAESYPQILRWLEFNRLFRCKIEPIPLWVLRSVPAFSAAARVVPAAASLKLSSATWQLLAELPRLEVQTSLDKKADEPDSQSNLNFDGLHGELLPFQIEAVEAAVKSGGRILLGDEMGLGKTVSALATIWQYRDEWPVLIVAPAPLCNLWREHVFTWFGQHLNLSEVSIVRSAHDCPPARAQILIVPYSLISEPRFQQHPNGNAFSVMIIDECHMLRGASSKRAGAVVPIAQRSKRLLLLSGTPLVVRAEDAFPIFAMLKPSDFTNIKDFSARYSDKHGHRETSGKSPGISSCVKHVRRQIAVTRRISELRTLLNACMLRRLKNDVLLQLPLKRRQKIEIDLDTKLSTNFSDYAAADTLRVKEDELQSHSLALSKAKVTFMVDYMRCLLSADVKFILFAYHLSTLTQLEGILSSEEVQYIRIDGSTSMESRSEFTKSFQNNEEIRVALLSLTACSQGLTLHAASLVVFAELFWVPGVLLQAEDRAHRLGQHRPVNVHYLVARGTIDERMYHAMERRACDTSGVVDGRASQACESSKDLPQSCGLSNANGRGLLAENVSAPRALETVLNDQKQNKRLHGQIAEVAVGAGDDSESDVEVIASSGKFSRLGWSSGVKNVALSL